MNLDRLSLFAKQLDNKLRSLYKSSIGELLFLIFDLKNKSAKLNLNKIPRDEYPNLIKELTGQMDLASANLEFEKAAELRDQIAEIKGKLR